MPATDYAQVPFDSAESLDATHQRAVELLRQQPSSEVDWSKRIEFQTSAMGAARYARQTILFHALLHSIRHYAQLATLVRQSGVKSGWPMDCLFLDMEKVNPRDGQRKEALRLAFPFWARQ